MGARQPGRGPCVRRRFDPAPFSQRPDVTPSNGFGRCAFTVRNGFGSGTFIAPAGVRLVIADVPAELGDDVGGNALFDLATDLNGAAVESRPPVISRGVIAGRQMLSLSSQTHIDADPGSGMPIALPGSGAGSNGSVVGAYGHHVPVNGRPRLGSEPADVEPRAGAFAGCGTVPGGGYFGGLLTTH